MPKLSLQWPVDSGGYHIKRDATRGSSRAEKTIAAGDQTWIVRNGGELEYRDRLLIHGLYEVLARCPETAEGALGFVSKFGYLKGGSSESVENILNAIRSIKAVLRLKRARKWEQLHLWLIENHKRIRANPELSGSDPPELFFRPATLHDAIYWQLLEDLTPGVKLRLCKRPGCGTWFKYGTGTGRRSTAQFCTPRCQNTFKNQLR